MANNIFASQVHDISISDFLPVGIAVIRNGSERLPDNLMKVNCPTESVFWTIFGENFFFFNRAEDYEIIRVTDTQWFK